MISLCNYCDRHTPADGSKWILNDLSKVEYQGTSGKACLQPSLQCRFWHMLPRTCATARPQLAKADTAFQGASVGQPTEPCLSEQIGTSLREANKRSTLVHHEPAALNREVQASPYSAGVPFSRSRNGPLIFSIWMRPSCTASVLLAISRILRAGLSGSE